MSNEKQLTTDEILKGYERLSEIRDIIYQDSYFSLDASLIEFFQFYTDDFRKLKIVVTYEKPSVALSVFVLTRGAEDLGRIVLRFVSEQKTFVSAQPVAGQSAEAPLDWSLRLLVLYILPLFLKYHDERRADFEHLRVWKKEDAASFTGSIGDILHNVPPPKRGRGAPTDPDNDWARAELELGRDRSAVFAEYLTRRNVNPKNRQAVAQARERFKKATAPTRGGK